MSMMWDDTGAAGWNEQNIVSGTTTDTFTTSSSSPNWKVYQRADVAEQRHQEVLEKFDYIQLPADLDWRNETVQSAVADWCEALDQLKLKHQQLKMLINLTKTHE